MYKTLVITLAGPYSFHVPVVNPLHLTLFQKRPVAFSGWQPWPYIERHRWADGGFQRDMINDPVTCMCQEGSHSGGALRNDGPPRSKGRDRSMMPTAGGPSVHAVRGSFVWPAHLYGPASYALPMYFRVQIPGTSAIATRWNTAGPSIVDVSHSARQAGRSS